MKTRQSYQQPDLDSIEELNYISTVEEDAIIDAHIEELREWGYGNITHAHDLHQLFWEFTRRGIILDKLFRVAVVECIDEEPLYTKFLGMAKRYNGWAQRQLETTAKEQRDFKKELAEKDSVIEMVRKNFRESQETIGKLKNEIVALKMSAKPKSEAEQISALRHELKKEYNIKLQELRTQTKPDKVVGKAFIRELMSPGTKLFEAYDLTKEEDIKEYIDWFRLGGRKINLPTQRIIAERYGEENLASFMTKVSAYNQEWESTHQHAIEQEDKES